MPSFCVFIEDCREEPDVLVEPRRAAAMVGKYPSVCPGRAVLGVGGVGCTETTDRIGYTLSAAVGLSTSSARKVGEFGGMPVSILSRGIGSPACVRAGFSMRGVVVPEEDLPSLSSVEANARPFSSSEARPAPLGLLLLSCSADIAVRSSHWSSFRRSYKSAEGARLWRQTRRGWMVGQGRHEFSRWPLCRGG